MQCVPIAPLGSGRHWSRDLFGLMTTMITVGRTSGTGLEVRYGEEGGSKTRSTCRTATGRPQEAQPPAHDSIDLTPIGHPLGIRCTLDSVAQVDDRIHGRCQG